jgi:hypothetical protein
VNIEFFIFIDLDYPTFRLTVTGLASVYYKYENGIIASTRGMILKQQFPPKRPNHLPEYTMLKFTGPHYENLPVANQEPSMFFIYNIVWKN